MGTVPMNEQTESEIYDHADQSLAMLNRLERHVEVAEADLEQIIDYHDDIFEIRRRLELIRRRTDPAAEG